MEECFRRAFNFSLTNFPYNKKWLEEEFGVLNGLEIVWLIDASNSMIPYEPINKNLCNLTYPSSPRFYFRNCWGEYLYLDQWGITPEKLTSILCRLDNQKTKVVIVSDGGAARGGYSETRVQNTVEFIKLLKPYVKRCLWLNPLPQDRWWGTTAQSIAAGWVDMMSFSEEKMLECRPVKNPYEVREELELVSPKLKSFYNRFGLKALELAAHAAYPETLTPELLYCIRENFVPDCDWLTVGDILIKLCASVGYRKYELYESSVHNKHYHTSPMRVELLKTIREKYGKTRLLELRQFM